jgi:hypothetical protein
MPDTRQYRIAMYDFEAAGWKPITKDGEAQNAELRELLAQEVKVATVWADGVRPRSFTPPSYGAPKRQVGLGGFYPWGGSKPYED